MRIALKITGLSLLILFLLLDATLLLFIGTWWYVFPIAAIIYISYVMSE